jgi:hypothetical protein
MEFLLGLRQCMPLFMGLILNAVIIVLNYIFISYLIYELSASNLFGLAVVSSLGGK